VLSCASFWGPAVAAAVSHPPHLPLLLSLLLLPLLLLLLLLRACGPRSLPFSSQQQQQQQSCRVLQCLLLLFHGCCCRCCPLLLLPDVLLQLALLLLGLQREPQQEKQTHKPAGCVPKLWQLTRLMRLLCCNQQADLTAPPGLSLPECITSDKYD
jgi:hypothetical protein